MSFQTWVATVQGIATKRGLILTTTYVTPTWVSFNWRAANNSRFGSSGAGAEFIGLTTPDEFTWDWYGTTPQENPVNPLPTPPPVPWERRGRYTPRVPAMAVTAAIQALFKIGK